MDSQNGWTAYASSANLSPLPWITGRVRPGPVWVIFDHLCRRFDAEVEPIVVGHSWGWAKRPIRGSSTAISNHASGTAIDLNAPRHPLGKHGTFTKKQVAAIEQILAELGGTVRWGGHYRGRKDEMHFEIDASAARVDNVAAQIKSGKKEKPVNQSKSMSPFADHIRAALADLRAARTLTKSWGKRVTIHAAITAIQAIPGHKESKR